MKEKIMHVVFAVAAATSILAVALICVFLFANGVPAMLEVGLGEFLGGSDWRPTASVPKFGILPMIVGSIYVTAGAAIVGVPIGILTAVFLAFYCPKPLYKPLKTATELLAGIPSVIYGFFGLMVVVPFIRQQLGGNGLSILTASLLLGMMILPTIIGVSESALRAVPDSFYEGSVALGATHEEAIFRTVLPAAKSGVMAGIILGIGRAVGETMAVIMVVGNQARIPSSILEGVRTLTGNIVIEMGYAAGLHSEMLVATGVVLFVFILAINLLFSILKRRDKYAK